MSVERVEYAIQEFIGKSGNSISTSGLAKCAIEALAEGLKWNETKPWHLEYHGELVGYVTTSGYGFTAVFFVKNLSNYATLSDSKRALMKEARRVLFGLKD